LYFVIITRQLSTRIERKVRANRNGLQLKKGESKALQCKGITVLAYNDNALVHHATDYLGPATVPVEKNRGAKRETVDRPVMNAAYSKTMKGTDVMNQREATYDSARKTTRWYMKFFIHIFEIIVLNAFLLHKRLREKKNESVMSLLNFRYKLINQLTKYAEEEIVYKEHFLKTKKLKRMELSCRKSARSAGNSLDFAARCATTESGNPSLSVQRHAQRNITLNSENQKKLLKDFEGNG
jgi:hypothetical protein